MGPIFTQIIGQVCVEYVKADSYHSNNGESYIATLMNKFVLEWNVIKRI